MLRDDFQMAVRQPTCKAFDHWNLDVRIPAGILPPHLPSARLGWEARKVVDMERWRGLCAICALGPIVSLFRGAI